jgi:hypothetical protein
MSSEVIGNSFMLHSAFIRPLAELGQGSSIEDPTKKNTNSNLRFGGIRREYFFDFSNIP